MTRMTSQVPVHRLWYLSIEMLLATTHFGKQNVYIENVAIIADMTS